MYLKNKQYKSEITDFIANLKSKNPELEKKQKFGRSILWDSTDGMKRKTNSVVHNEIKQSPYVYF